MKNTLSWSAGTDVSALSRLQGTCGGNAIGTWTGPEEAEGGGRKKLDGLGLTYSRARAALPQGATVAAVHVQGCRALPRGAEVILTEGAYVEVVD
jgi:hypothetical protein